MATPPWQQWLTGLVSPLAYQVVNEVAPMATPYLFPNLPSGASNPQTQAVGIAGAAYGGLPTAGTAGIASTPIPVVGAAQPPLSSAPKVSTGPGGMIPPPPQNVENNGLAAAAYGITAPLGFVSNLITGNRNPSNIHQTKVVNGVNVPASYQAPFTAPKGTVGGLPPDERPSYTPTGFGGQSPDERPAYEPGKMTSDANGMLVITDPNGNTTPVKNPFTGETTPAAMTTSELGFATASYNNAHGTNLTPEEYAQNANFAQVGGVYVYQGGVLPSGSSNKAWYGNSGSTQVGGGSRAPIYKGDFQTQQAYETWLRRREKNNSHQNEDNIKPSGYVTGTTTTATG